MPGVVGCVDGSHVRIVRPVNNEKAYVNRKNYHSINVQVKTNTIVLYNLVNSFYPL